MITLRRQFGRIIAMVAAVAFLVLFLTDRLSKLPFDLAHIEFVAHGQTSTGVIRTVAGTGTAGFCCDGGAATIANVSPESVAIDAAGILYIAEAQRIRKVDVATSLIGTFVGQLQFPSDVKLDASGNIY